MTNQNDSYGDILDNESPPELADLLKKLTMVYASSARRRLPDSARLATRAAIAHEALTSAQLGPEVGAARRKPSGRSIRRAGANGLLSRPVRYASLACAMLAVVVGLIVCNATTTTIPSVSASAVLQRAAAYGIPRGQFAHFTYRIRVTLSPIWKGTTNCRQGAGQTETTYSQVWIRGSEGGTPQAVIERSKPCDVASLPGCPSVLVGRQLYEYPGACLDLSQGPYFSPAAVMIRPTSWPISTLPSGLFYGPNLAYFLLHSLQRSTTVTAHHTVFQGHAAYELDVRNWPGESPGDDATLYFDAKTHLLLGLNSHYARYSIERLRLFHEQWYGAKAEWRKSLADLPRWRSSADGLISFPGTPTVADFIRACPGIDAKSIPIPTPTPATTSGAIHPPTRHHGDGLLSVCRTIHPTMTASLLAWRIMRPNIERLQAAVRIGIFSALQVHDSITYEHKHLAAWVTEPGSPVLY